MVRNPERTRGTAGGHRFTYPERISRIDSPHAPRSGAQDHRHDRGSVILGPLARQAVAMSHWREPTGGFTPTDAQSRVVAAAAGGRRRKHDLNRCAGCSPRRATGDEPTDGGRDLNIAHPCIHARRTPNAAKLLPVGLSTPDCPRWAAAVPVGKLGDGSGWRRCLREHPRPATCPAAPSRCGVAPAPGGPCRCAGTR